MILPIFTYGQPVLRKKAEDIPLDYPGLQTLIQDMFETCSASDGIGLAAPQIGKPIRLVVIDLDVISEHYPEYKGFKHAFINGHILEFDDSETETLEEGCLSLPGIHENVKRAKRVHVKYVDENLQEHDEWIDGYLARVVQHEFDHIEGKVFTDHISPFRKQMIAKKLKMLASGNFRCAYKVKPARR
nr:peptide deformylase [uncultured Prevotella sp.]